jgi:hypothetical protein
MMKWAIVKNEIADNVIIPGDDLTGLVEINDWVNIGDAVDLPEPIEANRVGAVMQGISELEAAVTPRRLRDAVLTIDGQTWLEDVEAQISALRADI